MPKSKFTREFLGKIGGFESKQEQRREQKHLKAYLKGYNRFTFGRDKERNPIYHPVLENLIQL